jgi:integrase
MTPGIETRHAPGCPALNGGECSKGKRGGCVPSHRAFVYLAREKRKHRSKWFHGKGAYSAAKNWREDRLPNARRGTLVVPSARFVREVAAEFRAKLESGEIKARSRKGNSYRPYKPSARRSILSDLDRYVLPEFGDEKMGELRRRDVQNLVYRLDRDGLSGSKIRNVVNTLRVLFRYAIQNEIVSSHPLDYLSLPEPAGRGHEWNGTPEDARDLIDALPVDIRAIYATAFYAGPRRGEELALRVSDLEHDGVRIERGWDLVEQVAIEPKSTAGKRKTLYPETLRVILAEHVQRTGRSGDDLVLGRTSTEPFTPTHVQKLADEAWTAARLERVTLHQCRHAFASFMADAGIPEDRRNRYMGHAGDSVGDLYLDPQRGRREKDAQLFDDYLTGKGATVIPGQFRASEVAAGAV